ncbi:MAG: 16S rRNA (uracil(1498)-N(3))-methyltransferase [Clostridia bacterium]|nr:16S rRNA (uracil(1498)-N(3))-methyltransferase [Clostridia bacterium]
MPRFFVPIENFDAEHVSITGDDAWHIARSLRMAVGEGITVCDMQGSVHECTLLSITDEMVIARIDESCAAQSESPVRVTLYQALPKGDKMDVIVQKAVESGVYAIVPFISERCVSRPDAKSLEKKCVRWQRIALEAAKQCGRGIIPQIKEPLTYEQMLDAAEGADLSCFCYEGDGTKPIKEVLRQANNVNSVSLCIGSEGGFSEKEFLLSKEKGLSPTGLGKRILRCESAPAFALACICYEYEL